MKEIAAQKLVSGCPKLVDSGTTAKDIEQA